MTAGRGRALHGQRPPEALLGVPGDGRDVGHLAGLRELDDELGALAGSQDRRLLHSDLEVVLRLALVSHRERHVADVRHLRGEPEARVRDRHGNRLRVRPARSQRRQ